MNGTVLAIEDLAVAYGRKLALKGVTFGFDGGALGLLGPNGAGKSSLLKSVLGLIAPARGEVRVLGMDARRRGREVRAAVGYMPESDCHIPGLSGLEFVTYCGRLSGLSAGDAKRRAHETLVYVGLDEQRYRPIDGYSRGMKQKVKFAAALVHDPSLLLLDEPTNGLDPQARGEILVLIRDLARDKGLHVVLSSHLLRDVESVCGELVLLAQGELRAAGRLGDLKALRGGYVVRVLGDPERFAAAAAAREIAVERDGHGALLASARGDNPLTAADLFALGRAAGTPLSHVVPAEESLEDLFLRSVGGD